LNRDCEGADHLIRSLTVAVQRVVPGKAYRSTHYAQEGCYDHVAVMQESAPRHSAIVRITHWFTAISVLALLISGIAILFAHPRLYWGEIGNVNTDALIELPIPQILANQNGWARYLHFLAAWVSVLTGFVYAIAGVWTKHFHRDLISSTTGSYDLLQRIAYSGVVFALFPLIVWTGLAMSPGFTAAVPFTVTLLGGQQCARTIHFFAASCIILFAVGHVVMVFRAGLQTFSGMITGHTPAKETA
jgi:thiosulfate reductase cytochrome b subunit